MRRLVLSIVVVSALLAAGAVAALATPGSSGQAATQQATGALKGTVGMRLEVSKFVKRGHRLVAKGRAVATYRSNNGTSTTRSVPFMANATVLRRAGRTLASTAQTTTCPVLTLELDTVSLDLLGLHVDLSKVVLTITADPNGGLLGKLFCQLASGKTAVASTSTARSLTSAVQQSGLSKQGVAFGTPTRQLQSLGPGPCSIVDLLLGPLHLELLGLIVDLNQIHLQITADPTEPPLGTLLCSIVQPPTTTATTGGTT
jgi:hypothetical protein